MDGVRITGNKTNHSSDIGPQKAVKALWTAAVLVLCLCFLALSFGYLNFVKGTIRQDAKSNIEELSGHIAQSLYSEINRTREVLGSLALEIGQRDLRSEAELLLFLTEQSEFWNFYDLALINEEGISCHQDGSKDIPANRQLLLDALNSGDITFDFLVAGGEDCVIFYNPLPPDVRADSGYLAVAGTYAVHNWDLLMNINIFKGQAVTQIISKNGVVITRGRGSEAVYNLLDYLSESELESGVTLEQVKRAVLSEEGVYLSYSLDNTEYYLSCSPIGFNGWSLVFTVPAAIVNDAGNQMAHSVLIISAALALIFLSLLVWFRISQFRAQKRIWDAAYVDDVTKGGNRHKFMLDAPALLKRGGEGYMLVYTNIDQFKVLNQRYGTAEADHILSTIHEAFMKSITERECCARLSADHFVLLMEKEGIEQRLEAFAKEQAVQTTQTGVTCFIRMTFGLCPAGTDGGKLTEVIDQANLAMKMSPMTESGIAVYNVTMMERAAREKALTEHMLQSSFQEEITIYLQPKVDIETGLVVGAEALARWINPEFGSVSPGEFIPLAEKAGIVCQIDWRAFDLVCRTLLKWRQEEKEMVPISFNLSKAQLMITDFLEHYREAIHRFNIPCRYLDFEFTESLLYENSGALQAAVDEIHSMGAQCSMDDFGFGYSSLGLLGQFEADTLKLDRSFFLGDVRPDSRNSRIVRSVIQIAESLGMHTVAEGVEDEMHVEMLRRLGCDTIQGFYFSRPLPIEEFEEYVIKRKEGEKDENEK